MAYMFARANELAKICRIMRGRFAVSSQKCPRPDGMSCAICEQPPQASGATAGS
eukprot:COSAG01_NODE_69420_length_261_cov_0.950617_1_plen_53_part_10